MPSSRPTVVEVVHQNAVIAAGIRCILETSPEFAVRRPRAPASAPEPDLVVIDADGGLERLARRRAGLPAGAAVVVVSIAAQEADVRRTWEAGARAYVILGGAADEIVLAARAVAAGRRYLCPAATLLMADSLTQPVLTPREGDVLALVNRGHNNKEVARSLEISVGTVKSHMRGIMAKLGARCRTEALWIASQRGLIARSAGQAHLGAA